MNDNGQSSWDDTLCFLLEVLAVIVIFVTILIMNK